MASKSRGKLGCLGALLLAPVVLGVITAVLAPWAFHMGGRWTAGFWQGVGELRTTAGDKYPLYVYFFPDFGTTSQLYLHGQRPSSGLKGSGWLCSAPGQTQRLDLSGDVYGSYLTTEGNQTSFRLLDARKSFRINPQHRRYVDLYGRWNGGELVMQDDGGWERGFHPDPHDPKARAQVTFTWGGYSDFKRTCEAASIQQKARIAPPQP